MGTPTGIYVRISDDGEGRELGTLRQEQDNREAAERAGDTIVDVYKDNDISASTRTKKIRPDFQRMLADARSGRIRRIRAYTSGRLTRKPRESEDLIELAENYGVEIIYLRSPSFDLNTSAGRRVARILGANDAGEAEDISERVRRKQLEIVESGGYLGGRRPFGYEDDGLTVRESEAEIVRSCSVRLLAGQSLYSMAAELNAKGATTSMGFKFRPNTLRDILTRARNAGLVRYQGEVAGAAQWPALVDEGTWRAVCATVADPSRLKATGNAQVHLGGGLYLCGLCLDGTTVKSTTTRGGPAVRNPRGYRCRKSGHLIRIGAPVDNMVERFAVAKLADASSLLMLKTPEVDLPALHAEATKIRARRNELDDELDDDVIDKARWRRRTERLERRLLEVEATMTAAAVGSALDGLAGNPDIARIWYGLKEDRSDGLPVTRRAAVVNALMTVTLLPARPGRKPGGGYFDPSCVRIEPKG